MPKQRTITALEVMLKFRRNKSYQFQKFMFVCATQTVTAPDVAAGVPQKHTMSF